MRTSQPSLTGLLVGVVAIAMLLAGLALESTLAAATNRARGDLPRALTAALREAPSDDDAEILREAADLVTARQSEQAATLLATRTEDIATPATHALAAHAALAAGDFTAAARQAHFAARLQPTEQPPVAMATRALDLAVLARLRTLGRPLGALALLFLGATGWRAHRRRRHQRRMATWLKGLRGRVVCRVDGEVGPADDVVRLGPNTRSLTVDVFLRQLGVVRHAPQPGPTLAVVLSQGASNCSLRLTPHHDVRGDAIRIRVKDATLARVLERPGAWRLQAHADGRLVGDAELAVVPRPPRKGLRLQLVGSA